MKCGSNTAEAASRARKTYAPASASAGYCTVQLKLLHPSVNEAVILKAMTASSLK
jgi:hypothetical protein